MEKIMNNSTPSNLSCQRFLAKLSDGRVYLDKAYFDLEGVEQGIFRFKDRRSPRVTPHEWLQIAQDCVKKLNQNQRQVYFNLVLSKELVKLDKVSLQVNYWWDTINLTYQQIATALLTADGTMPEE